MGTNSIRLRIFSVMCVIYTLKILSNTNYFCKFILLLPMREFGFMYIKHYLIHFSPEGVSLVFKTNRVNSNETITILLFNV
jgi:hypothetical protein